MKEWIKAIILLPFNVTVSIPCLILYFVGFKYITPNLLQIILGLMLLMFGLFLAIWAMYLFHKIGKGTLAPWAQTKNLVIEGPYKYVRNPMIIGVLSILLSEVLILNTIWLFYWFVLFFVINSVYFKLYEEKQLEKAFGSNYLKYKKDIPMWLPKIKLK